MANMIGAAGGPAARPAQVLDEMEQLGQALARLEKQIADLEGRIQPILRQEPPSNNTADKAERESLVVIAAGIRDFRFGTERLERQVNSLLQRIEI